MQMLSAAGLPTVGTYPDFEVMDVAHALPGDPCTWLEHSLGKAVKVLDPHRRRPPAGPDYFTIWLRRDYDEQARSALKLTGTADTRENRRAVAGSLRRESGAAKRALLIAGGHAHGILELTFEGIVLDPNAAAREIADYLGRELDITAMAACARARPTSCLPYMLEHQLVASSMAGFGR
jgi:hypothetical protein